MTASASPLPPPTPNEASRGGPRGPSEASAGEGRAARLRARLGVAPGPGERPGRYALALGLVLAALLARLALGSVLPPVDSPFLTFFPAAALAALYGGLGPGLAGVALSAVAAKWFFVPHAHSLVPASGRDAVALASFAGVALLGVAAVEAMHRALARAALTRVLRESEARFRGTFEQAAVGMAHVGLDGTWLRVNRRLCELLGYTEAELMARTFQSITHPDDLGADLGNVRRLLAGEVASYAMEKRYRRGDGSTVWANLTVSLARDAAGAPGHFISVVEDISARKAAETALRASEARLRDLLATLDLGTFVARGLDGTIRFWSEGCERLYGWTRDEAVGRPWHELLRVEFPRPPAEIEAELLARGAWQGELRTRRRDGREVAVASRWSLRRAPDGTPLAVAEAFNDITALRATEAELRRGRDLLASVLDGSADPISAKDAEGRYVILNRPAAAVLGCTVEAALDRRAAEILVPEDAAAADALDREVMETGEVRMQEHDVPAPDGERRFFLTTKAPWRDAQGRVTGVIGVSRDITLRRRAEERARRMQAELMHVSRLSAMGTMATALAHELNQPLTAAANFANAARRLLAGDAPPDPARVEDARRAMAEAADEAVRAGKIVRHLRELVARGDGEKRPRGLNALVEAAATLALAGAREQGVAARFAFDPRSPQVLVDRVQVQQVVVNLVRNAVEAVLDAPRREVAVTTALLGDGMVEVGVADTGPGLAEGVVERLFEPFVTTKQHGMGVGLSISRSIVEQHSGRLAAEANPGGGTVFRFTLPRMPEGGHAG